MYVYFGGIGVEIMVNFDNVLCGGLMSKYIDVKVLLDYVNMIFELCVGEYVQ